jgi:hypothetical protein
MTLAAASKDAVMSASRVVSVIPILDFRVARGTYGSDAVTTIHLPFCGACPVA